MDHTAANAFACSLRYHNKCYLDKPCPFETCGTEKQHLALQPPVAVEGEQVDKCVS